MISEPLLPPLPLHVKYRLGMITLQAKQTYIGREAICLEGKSITPCWGNIISALFLFSVLESKTEGLFEPTRLPQRPLNLASYFTSGTT